MGLADKGHDGPIIADRHRADGTWSLNDPGHPTAPGGYHDQVALATVVDLKIDGVSVGAEHGATDAAIQAFGEDHHLIARLDYGQLGNVIGRMCRIGLSDVGDA